MTIPLISQGHILMYTSVDIKNGGGREKGTGISPRLLSGTSAISGIKGKKRSESADSTEIFPEYEYGSIAVPCDDGTEEIFNFSGIIADAIRGVKKVIVGFACDA
jgi:hypothetical protein